jgi:hypothetical protein
LDRRYYSLAALVLGALTLLLQIEAVHGGVDLDVLTFSSYGYRFSYFGHTTTILAYYS